MHLDSTNPSVPHVLEASTHDPHQATSQALNNDEGSTDPLGLTLLTQALQPDKIFDLPMALVKVQQAFQSANQNAERLKDSLETVLQREQGLL